MAAYGRLCTLFYDADKPRASDAEVAWYSARLPKDAGPALEVMAGSGRLLIPLLQAGRNVHGVDSSAAMIASCETRLAAADLATPLFRQDVVALNVPFRYAAAFVAAGSFQLLTDPVGGAESARAHSRASGRARAAADRPVRSRRGRASARRAGRPGADGHAARRHEIARRSEIFVDVEGRRIDIRSRYEQRERATIMAREDEIARRDLVQRRRNRRAASRCRLSRRHDRRAAWPVGRHAGRGEAVFGERDGLDTGVASYARAPYTPRPAAD